MSGSGHFNTCGSVLVSVAMKLKTYISERNVVLGSTDDGKAWALKALHPADPLTEVRGIPDHDALPTVLQNFQFSFPVTNATPGTAGTWSFDLFLFANPVVVGGLRTIDSSGAYLWQPIVNQQIGSPSATWEDRQPVFVNSVEKYRLAYMGITGHQDSAAVTNQGQIAVAQYPLSHAEAAFFLTSASPGSMFRPVEVYDTLPKTWAQIQTLPNAYLATAKEGCYAPYKLSETCQEWQSTRNMVQFVPYGNHGTVDETHKGGAFPNAGVSLTTQNDAYPYGLIGSSITTDSDQSVILRRSDSGIIHIAGINLHSSSSFVFVFRAGYELQVAAGSPLTPFARISPRYDPIALDGYFATAREFKDAYPEDYNSWEKILDVIGPAAEAAAEVLPFGKAILGGIKGVGRLLFPKLANRDVTTMSAAEKDEAREVAKASTNSPRRTLKQKRKRTQFNPKLYRK